MSFLFAPWYFETSSVGSFCCRSMGGGDRSVGASRVVVSRVRGRAEETGSRVAHCTIDPLLLSLMSTRNILPFWMDLFGLSSNFPSVKNEIQVFKIREKSWRFFFSRVYPTLPTRFRRTNQQKMTCAGQNRFLNIFLCIQHIIAHHAFYTIKKDTQKKTYYFFVSLFKEID